ncbi:MAG: hypothetical protein ABID54_05590 [Pseudomonadota bacterium]
MLTWHRVGVVILVIVSLIVTGVETVAAAKKRSLRELSSDVKRLEEDFKGLDNWLQVLNGDHKALSDKVREMGQRVNEISEEMKGLNRWLEELSAGHKTLVTIVKDLNEKVNQLTQKIGDADRSGSSPTEGTPSR